MTTELQALRDQLRTDLESARRGFHAALAGLPDEAWARPSANPGWTNGQLLFHITFGFILVGPLLLLLRLVGRFPASFSRVLAALLDACTGLFNRVNALGPRGGARRYDRDALARKYDRVQESLLRTLDRLPAGEWDLGMYYPRRWDPRFKEYMRIEDLFRYPVRHQQHHLDQLKAH